MMFDNVAIIKQENGKLLIERIWELPKELT